MTQYIDELTTAASADYAKKRVANPDYPVYNDEYEIECAFEAGAKWGMEQTEVKIQAQSIAVAHGCPKETVSNDLEEAARKVGQKYFPDKDNIWARPNYEAKKTECAFMEGTQWQKQQDQSTIELAEDHAYLAGQEIVIEKACGWLKCNFNMPNVFESHFKKAMEE